jgi:CHAD domain-containing protein
MLTRDQSMPEAGTVVLARYWQQADKREGAVRTGGDPEAIHDMRVAVRRLRAALAFFAPWYPRKEAAGLAADLRRLGRTLGAVRDLEVLLSDAQRAAASLPDADLSGLLAHWEAGHVAARGTLVGYLDSRDYHRFRRRVEAFLETHRETGAIGQREAGQDARGGRGAAVTPSRVCDVLPAEVWSRYGAVHAYAPVLAAASLERLHRLRIAGKRLRYLLEAFAEVLGEDVQGVIQPLKELQDALGTLHDADVATGLLQTYGGGHAGATDGIAPYVEYQQAAMAAARSHFEQIWPTLVGEAVRKQLAESVASL